MSVDRSAEPEATQQLVVHRRDVPQLTVYSWARQGTMHSAWPGDGKTVPPDGTEIKLRIVAFPGGASVREIWLDKEARTAPHPSYEAVLFYQIDGRRVQMCNEHSHQVNPGDACLEPCGVQHSTFQLIAGLFVEFALPAPPLPNGEATWIAAADARIANPTPGCIVRTFDLPGHPLYETRLAQGAQIALRSEALDQLFYVVNGRLRATLGATVEEVETGDCMRCPAGQAHGCTALEDTVFIQTAVPQPAAAPPATTAAAPAG